MNNCQRGNANLRNDFIRAVDGRNTNHGVGPFLLFVLIGGNSNHLRHYFY